MLPNAACATTALRGLGTGTQKGCRSSAGTAGGSYTDIYQRQHLCLSTARLNIKHWLKREHAGRQLSEALAESCRAGSKGAGRGQASPPTASGRGNPAPLPAPPGSRTHGGSLPQAAHSPGRPVLANRKLRRHPEPTALCPSPSMPCPRCGGLEIPQVCAPPAGLMPADLQLLSKDV